MNTELIQDLKSQKQKDDELFLEITNLMISAIQSTRVVQNIKTKFTKQFFQYFTISKQLYSYLNQKAIIESHRHETNNPEFLSRYIPDDNLIINPPVNFCERSSNELADICRRVVLATRLDEKEKEKLKFLLLNFFISINSEINFEKNDDDDENINRKIEFSANNLFNIPVFSIADIPPK
ncbi:hypothetical protein TRFO_12752 [Tritrichomonas foetus]|uniref:Uncharacterized protein n=1 Tax=Tritrichomonas foetus TaxID=1144522 RepID=A0A1J4L0T5_9EUKA|nr:hypothetical protein TRFO_12752 [Tritrichomonas foetus]|eukprot:OHT17043.1 hypothetical protein TRFO_12752 [Tritrichomonas foetus]